MLSEQLGGLIMTALRKSAEKLVIIDHNIDLGFTEALLHELLPHLQRDFNRARWHDLLTDLGIVVTEEILTKCERLWTADHIVDADEKAEVTGDMVKPRGEPIEGNPHDDAYYGSGTTRLIKGKQYIISGYGPFIAGSDSILIQADGPEVVEHESLCDTCGGSNKVRSASGRHNNCQIQCCPVTAHWEPCPDCKPVCEICKGVRQIKLVPQGETVNCHKCTVERGEQQRKENPTYLATHHQDGTEVRMYRVTHMKKATHLPDRRESDRREDG